MSAQSAQNNGAIKVARYLIARASDETGMPMTNLKLQKLAYYAQGFALAIRDRELFTQSIEAWNKGPVVPSVYRTFSNGSKPIHPASDFDIEDYLPETRELLDAILATYGRLSAGRLSGMTHNETPWNEAYSLHRNSPLSLPTMKTYFSGLVEASREGRIFKEHPVLPIHSFKHQRRRELSDRMERHREKLRAIASRPRNGTDPWVIA